MYSEEHWYSIHGRIRRSTWALRVFGGGFAMVLAVAVIMGLAPHDLDPEERRSIAVFPAMALVLGFLLFRFIQDIKRLHDLGKSGVWVVCAFIPLVNLIYVCFILFADGQPFTNEFGADPKGRGSDIDDVVDVFR